MTRQLTDRQQRAYSLGVELAKIADSNDYDIETAVNRWAYGDITLSHEFNDIDWANHTEPALFDMGTQGAEIKFVDGWRYGSVPTRGFSYNFKDNYPEKGVSCMEAGGEKTQNRLSALFISQNAVRVNVNGLLLPDKGADGEPLLILVQTI
jgi:hypothetical protein